MTKARQNGKSELVGDPCRSFGRPNGWLFENVTVLYVGGPDACQQRCFELVFDIICQ